MPSPPPSVSLIEPETLAERLGEKITILDCSWYMPGTLRSAYRDYNAAHIPGARFFDLDQHSDLTSPYPHMFPPFDVFARQLGALAIEATCPVVVYDSMGMFSAPRVWWMLGAMGHDQVAVLNGGLPQWRRLGLPLTATATPPSEAVDFVANPRPERIYNCAQIDALRLKGKTASIIDTRSPDRFNGQCFEPRPGLRRGHIPGSRNIHYQDVLDQDSSMLPPSTLATYFDELGIKTNETIVTTCGSGVTAAIVLLALTQVGYRQLGLYDGSWSEWGQRHDLPVATA